MNKSLKPHLNPGEYVFVLTDKIYGINEEDRLNCYYIIDEIIFNSNLEGLDLINIIIRLNIYPTIQDRNDRVNLLGSEEYEKTINRSDFNGNILENYYLYCKPLIIENKNIDVEPLDCSKYQNIINKQKNQQTFANLASLLQSFEIGKERGKDLIFFIEDDYF